MLVGQPIHRALPISAIRDQPSVAQEPELVADAGLAHSDDLGEVTYAQLAQGQSFEHSESSGIGERREDRGGPIDSRLSRERRAHAGHSLDVGHIHRALGVARKGLPVRRRI